MKSAAALTLSNAVHWLYLTKRNDKSTQKRRVRFLRLVYTQSTMLAASISHCAMISTLTSSVMSCHNCSRREYSVPLKSAMCPRKVCVVGAPRCWISSTVKLRAASRQPSHNVSDTPSGGNSTSPSASESSRSSCPASNPR